MKRVLAVVCCMFLVGCGSSEPAPPTYSDKAVRLATSAFREFGEPTEEVRCVDRVVGEFRCTTKIRRKDGKIIAAVARDVRCPIEGDCQDVDSSTLVNAKGGRLDGTPPPSTAEILRDLPTPDDTPEVCKRYRDGDPNRAACENSYEVCSVDGGAQVAKDIGFTDTSDVYGFALAYSQAQYGSSGVRAQVAARQGCRAGLGDG